MTVLLAIASFVTKASAVTLSYDYAGVGSVSFQSNTVLNIGGACSSPCVISVVMTIAGTGPLFNAGMASGWGAGASTTVEDNVGDTTSLAVNNGDVPETIHNISGSFLLASVLPSTLSILTSSFADFLGGPGTVDYSINIGLPNGAYVTPLPTTLPLFATGVAALGLLFWRTRRKVKAAAE